MVRVRFAPSPTGYLHLGNVRTALYNYLFAKKNQGVFILRVEDTDVGRSRKEYLLSQMEDLRWLGIQWDEGPETGGPYGPYLQSERLDIYRGYVDKLLAEGKAYYCYVTEEESEEMKRLAKLERRPPRFDNRGRHFSAQEIDERKQRGVKPTIRFKIDSPLLTFTDLIRGEVSFNLDDMMGDFVIMRADGSPTFHLAVTIDDALMKVTHVIRGEDHLSNTPKHILLYRAMGFEPPQFGHLSLVHGPGNEPLSKRLESVSVREYRRKGFLPEAFANYLCLLGWSSGDDKEIFKWEELVQAFDISRVSRSASIYDPIKLEWLNGEHLRMLSDEEFVRRCMDYLRQRGQLQSDPQRVASILPAFKDSVFRLEELEQKLAFLADDFPYENLPMVQSAEGKQVLAAASEILAAESASSAGFDYERLVVQVKEKTKIKGKPLFMPLRIALTGKEHGPELKKILAGFSTELICKRIEKALQL